MSEFDLEVIRARDAACAVPKAPIEAAVQWAQSNADRRALLAAYDALRSRLAAVLEWLKDPRLSQWPYMEDGDFYDDLSEQVAAIEKTLCTPDSASVTQEKNP